MPNIARTGPYRWYFYSHEPNEPPHIHVDRDECSVKFWLEPVTLAKNLGFSPPEPRKLEAAVAERKAQFLEAWDEYFERSGG